MGEVKLEIARVGQPLTNGLDPVFAALLVRQLRVNYGR